MNEGKGNRKGGVREALAVSFTEKACETKGTRRRSREAWKQTFTIFWSGISMAIWSMGGRGPCQRRSSFSPGGKQKKLLQ